MELNEKVRLHFLKSIFENTGRVRAKIVRLRFEFWQNGMKKQAFKIGR